MIKQTVRKRSQRQEKAVAAALAARPVVGSGSCPFYKGDVRNDMFLIEAKFTDAHFYSLQLAIWNKIKGEAERDGLRIPAMVIDVCYEQEDSHTFVVVERDLLTVDFLMSVRHIKHRDIETAASSIRLSADNVPCMLRFLNKGKPVFLYVGHMADMNEFMNSFS